MVKIKSNFMLLTKCLSEGNDFFSLFHLTFVIRPIMYASKNRSKIQLDQANCKKNKCGEQQSFLFTAGPSTDMQGMSLGTPKIVNSYFCHCEALYQLFKGTSFDQVEILCFVILWTCIRQVYVTTCLLQHVRWHHFSNVLFFFLCFYHDKVAYQEWNAPVRTGLPDLVAIVADSLENR